MKKKTSSKKVAPKTIYDLMKDKVTQLLEKTPLDITQAIKDDHDSLRNYMGLLKDTKQNMTERRRAYVAFASLLKSHTLAEEKAVYVPSMKKFTGHELHIKVAEGYVEHELTKVIIKRIEAAKDPLKWSAHANVIAEILEHHLKEEERDLLPLIKKAATPEENEKMLQKYLDLRKRSQKKVVKKNAGVLESAKQAEERKAEKLKAAQKKKAEALKKKEELKKIKEDLKKQAQALKEQLKVAKVKEVVTEKIEKYEIPVVRGDKKSKK